jgi:predicted transcriptional regulator
MTKAMTLRLPDAIHEALRRQAFEDYTTVTALIIRAIEDSRVDSGWLCDERKCWNAPTHITPGGFHFCDEHGGTR